MVYVLFTLLVFSNSIVHGSKIFTHANEGAVLAGHPTLTCRSSDCRAIQTQNIDICMTQECRAIVGDSEYACTYWDCNVVIYAKKHGPLPRALAAALCVTPNCIAIVTQNPNEAQDIDEMVMLQFNYETGLRGHLPTKAAPLIQAWQTSTYYDPANLKESFRLFAIHYVAEEKREFSKLFEGIEIEQITCPTCVSPDSPLYPGNHKKKTRECKTCTIL